MKFIPKFVGNEKLEVGVKKRFHV